jgi:hypothetical protein
MDGCLENIKTDRHENYNYQLLMSAFFGFDYKEKLLKNFQSLKGSRVCEYIGKQMKMIPNQAYVEDLKRVCNSKLNGDISSKVIYDLLTRYKIKLTKKEEVNFTQEMGGDNFFTVEDFIKNCKLDINLFYSEDLQHVSKVDREDCDRIMQELRKQAHSFKLNIQDAFKIDN